MIDSISSQLDFGRHDTQFSDLSCPKNSLGDLSHHLYLLLLTDDCIGPPRVRDRNGCMFAIHKCDIYELLTHRLCHSGVRLPPTAWTRTQLPHTKLAAPNSSAGAQLGKT